jgi:branched-subunit amino acid ABC-type transport system permease component
VPTPPGLDGAITLLGIGFSRYRLFVILVAALVGLGLLIAWRRSRIGAILRAGVSDKEMVGLLGIDLPRVFTLTFAVGAALAGLSGVIAGPFLSIYPGMEDSALIQALVVVVLGGLGSIEGALLGAVLIGLAYSFGAVYLPQFAIASDFAVMAAVLVFRPAGLFGLRR